MKLGLETECYHLLFQHKRMDIFDFIEQTARLGLDGVEINIIPDYNLHPEFGVLDSDDPIYLARIKEAIQSRNLYCELDTKGTDKVSLTKAIEFAVAIGADVIRTYIPVDQFDPKNMQPTIDGIKQIIPLLKKYRIKLALENHELETSDDIIHVVKAVDSLWFGAHYDCGNSMMVWEDPVEAAKKMAPYTYCTHFKDHIVTKHNDELVICGVPIGEGSIDIDECFRILVENAPITRINIESCHPYCARFTRERGAGGVFELNGAFELKKPLFDPELIKPMEYYHPHNISQQAVDLLIDAQIEGVKRSVAFMKKIRNKYCQ
ncbi:sugar phosphate isomerase/epimerase family protein [Psychromonas hadalis]|uniref:sugar phosphate isomerase/epimerase family protein n=1 Tax=Psychromonas hadalis TaxID=211669 RepID=UPI0003B621D0|nr:sugar phosphate isomerase/epimerase family protein [Psychromonas hadalis]